MSDTANPIRFYARCETCRQYYFSPADVIAFQLRNKAIQPVALGGRDPWSGVFCVCLECARTIGQMLKERG